MTLGNWIGVLGGAVPCLGGGVWLGAHWIRSRKRPKDRR